MYGRDPFGSGFSSGFGGSGYGGSSGFGGFGGGGSGGYGGSDYGSSGYSSRYGGGGSAYTPGAGSGGRSGRSGYSSRFGGGASAFASDFGVIRTRDIDIPDTPANKVGPYSKLAGKSYEEIKAHCLQNGTLFTDPDFPANSVSLGMPGRSSRYTWKRPKQITRLAKFMSDGVSRFDVKQGELGDCWLCAGLVALCNNRSLLDQVVPSGQSMEDGEYAGVFCFNFWQYGKWTEVIVDDQIPTIYNQPAFISSSDETEFWSALLEKAYAKLHGSYGALDGGHAIEAMEDFTGGLCEWFDLRDNAPDDLFTIIQKAMDRHSLLSCAIDAKSSGEREAELDNGLVMGHAYTLNWVKELTLRSGRQVQLIRLRNPWGNDKEWNLAWSDRSSEWYQVSEYDKQEIDYAKSDDGEFWMSHEDFVRCFTKLEICNLGPDALTDELAERCNKKWEMITHEGEWIRNVTAGGCMNNWKTTFCTNPQFQIEVESPDDDDDRGTVLVALMQKQKRSIKVSTTKNIPIGFSIFKLDDPNQGLIDINFIRSHGNPTYSTEFTNLREVSNRYKMHPGHYCIIPSTFEPGDERNFIMRIYSEKPHTSNELDETTKELEEEEEEEEEDEDMLGEESEEEDEEETGYKDDTLSSGLNRLHSLLTDRDERDDMAIEDRDEAIRIMGKSIKFKPETPAERKKIVAAFGFLSDYDLEIDANVIREIIIDAYGDPFDVPRFSVDVCRSMVAMLDDDRSGKLNFREAKKLWKSLRKWSTIFKENDIDDNGYLRTYQLRQVIRSVGYTVSNQTFQTLVQRYGDPEGKLYFQDFIQCVVRLNNMFEVFEESGLGGTIELNLDQFIQTTMYS